MEKKEESFFKSRIVLGTFAVFVLILGIILGITLNVKNRPVEDIGSDIIDQNKDNKTAAEIFKEDYESLNGGETTSGKEIIKMNIDKDNPIKYISYKKLIEMLDNGNGVVYIGFNSCPWCRNAVPVLLEAAKNQELKDIYYLNIKNNQLLMKTDENGESVRDEGAVEAQLKLADRLYADGVYDELESSGGKTIYSPTVLFIKDGKIVSSKLGTVSSQSDPYVSLTEEQHSELLQFYEKGIEEVK